MLLKGTEIFTLFKAGINFIFNYNKLKNPRYYIYVPLSKVSLLKTW